MDCQDKRIEKVLIAGITPYFLEKGNFWLEENLKSILAARLTQAFFEDNTLYLEKDQKSNLSQVLRKLDEMGYEKTLSVQEPGEFSHQGGTIDVFPINKNCALRLEFLGNKIDNIEKLPTEIDDEEKAKEKLKKKLKSQKLFSDLRGIKPGDFLVHLDHGIGKFIGIENFHFSTNNSQLSKDQNQYYALEYALGDKLYVPLGLERKLSRYISFAAPSISRLGSFIWQKTKRKIKEDVEKLAKELLEIAASREISARPPYSPDYEIDQQIADGFPYEETPDQLQTIQDIERDLAKSEPMDRLVCGDVGFGKTEMALRTAMKAVSSGYQAAIICPTTILANQHFLNFKERTAKLPVKVSLLSRLQSKNEQQESLKGLKEGKIDIVIGTHRLLSNDIEFKNLGLLIIDDEQRFGVKQKEKFKKIRASLDVLSLSATPIPRTLYLALSSLKNVSIIQTPPARRLSVKTFVGQWNEKTIKQAIANELNRKGQVYYLHNRVETIETARRLLEKLAPKARVETVHGRLKEKKLIKVFNDFRDKKIDILAATTIIENGLDVPGVNTIIIADTGRLGLAQAHQIRGRVGRSDRQAFAYFCHQGRLSEKAELRLEALKDSELGSGYQIALKDLEIRGAGNILGKEQSGSINQVGLNLYCQILSDAIERLKTGDKKSSAL